MVGQVVANTEPVLSYKHTKVDNGRVDNIKETRWMKDLDVNESLCMGRSTT